MIMAGGNPVTKNEHRINTHIQVMYFAESCVVADTYSC
jgi:hypothetical protein